MKKMFAILLLSAASLMPMKSNAQGGIPVRYGADEVAFLTEWAGIFVTSVGELLLLVTGDTSPANEHR